MQVNYNYNWQECIGDANGLVQRNLWSYLESEQLTPQTKTYDSFSGTWFDNGRWGNNAYVSGNKNSITDNTGSFGGYNIDFGSSGGYPTGSNLYWTSRYTSAPKSPTFEGQCIFIQWQSSPTYTNAVSLFQGGAYSSFWGGRALGSGSSYEYLGWPNADQQTTQTNPLLDLTTKTAMYMQLLGTPDGIGSNIFAYNTGVGMNVSGSQVACSIYGGPDDIGKPPLYIKDNPYPGGFDFTNNNLTFGVQSTMPYPFTNQDGTQTTYQFRGVVKRILVYNSVLSGNEIAQNWKYLQTLP